jgi:hypothetical protein
MNGFLHAIFNGGLCPKSKPSLCSADVHLFVEVAQELLVFLN